MLCFRGSCLSRSLFRPSRAACSANILSVAGCCPLVASASSTPPFCFASPSLVLPCRGCASSAAASSQKQQRRPMASEFDGHVPATTLLMGVGGLLLITYLASIFFPNSFVASIFNGFGSVVNTFVMIFGWIFGF